MNESDRFEAVWASALGPVFDQVIEDADVYLAGLDELVMSGVNVTVRESAGVPGWVGVVDADLTRYIEFKLELRMPGESADCAILFVVGGEVLGRTVIRGTGRMPGVAPRIRNRPRVTPKPRELH